MKRLLSTTMGLVLLAVHLLILGILVFIAMATFLVLSHAFETLREILSG